MTGQPIVTSRSAVRTVGIVGASLAGVSAARALRARGFDGRIVIVGDEPHAPYDRPPLSKALLAGTVTRADLDLLADGETLDAEWCTGVPATGLAASEGAVVLADGRRIQMDGVVLATGARARQPWAVLAGVHTLRTVEDALALRAELRSGARLVVVGAGFIGAEVASTAHALGVEVTVLEAATAPLAGALGPQLGAVVSGLHALHGVRLESGVAVEQILGTDRVTGVRLADGRTVDADVVLLGLGVTPNVEWLAGSGLELDGGVQCDQWGATSLPQVVAVGDCAAWFDPALERHRRVEHWSSARERADVAVATLLSGGQERAAARPSYFWSHQYGRTLQVTGDTHGADEVVIEHGAVADLDFLAVYRRAGLPVAALSIGQPKAFMRWRKHFASAQRSAAQVAA